MVKEKKSQQSSMQTLPQQSQRSGGSNQNIRKSPNTSPRQKIESPSESLLEYVKRIYRKATKTQITLSGLVSTAICILTAKYFLQNSPIPIVYQNMNYDLLYHCPISYALQDKLIQKSPMAPEVNKYLGENADQLNSSYFVGAFSSFEIQNSNNSLDVRPLKLLYCGYARLYNQTCKDATFACSSPGPAFDVQAHKEITVIWVNNYTKPKINQSSQNKNSMDLVQGSSANSCFSKHSKDATQLCNKTAKDRKDSKLFIYDPTDKFSNINCHSKFSLPKHNQTFKVLSSRQAIPLSPHVHGLQVQPYYDGNPLSWWDNNGEIGVGYFQNNKYEKQKIKHFKESTFLKLLKYLKTNGQNKIHIYRNCQQPGTLWYHDHAMGVTKFNVALGLHSYYVIRNSSIQNKLPSGEFEKFIFMYSGMTDASFVEDCRKQCLKFLSPSPQCQKCKNESSGVKAIVDQPLQYDTTYRFRILNGDFSATFENIKFQYNYKCGNQQTKTCKEKKNFTFSVIGTDSALKRTSADNVKSVRLTPGQRIDILVTIQVPNKTKVQEFEKLQVISYKQDVSGGVSQFKTLAYFSITNKTNGKKIPINNVTLDVPFVNLSSINDQDIAVKRMRPLVFAGGSFGINGHLRFHQGASENPKIGTIQDWYFINTMSSGHPLHIHLIQFQVLQIYQLKYKTFQNGARCQLYYLDFIKQQVQKFPENQISKQIMNNITALTNYSGLCQSIQNLKFKKYFLLFNSSKNEIEIDDKRISGLNVMEKCKDQIECRDVYGQTQKSTNLYKYIDKSVDTSSYLQEYQRGWKQTFFVPPKSVVKIRIRWTKTEFPQQDMNPRAPQKSKKGCQNGYFSISEQQLTRSPGYVYHCHILGHEDNEMMRPIMVQPSGCHKNLPPWRQRFEKQYCQHFQNKKAEELKPIQPNDGLRK